MSETRAGHVQIKLSNFGTRREGDSLVLFEATSSRFVALNTWGQSIWEALQSGTTDISSLVRMHAAAAHISPELAAYHVVSFLEELRSQGILDFRLERERESAPLLDVALEAASIQPVIPVGFAPVAPGRKRVVSLDSPRENLTLGDAKRMGEQAGGSPSAKLQRTFVFQSHGTISTDRIAELAQSNFQVDDPALARVAALDNPDTAIKVGDLRTLAGAAGVHTFAPAALAAPAARFVIVIVIITDDTIIIIVISGGGGPSAGKSRQACKTMCV